jgi:phosphoribosylanthranilate isomerase
VSVNDAAAIAREIPALVDLVGVFVDPAPGQVEAVLDQVPVTVLQFHGNETALICEHFKLPYIKAVRMKPEIDPLQADQLHPNAGALLLDTYRQQEIGGTGASFDWTQARVKTRAPIILAGGLRTGNVSEALAQSDAWGVDVSTGVEVMPGLKDAEQIKMFCRTVREFDGQWRAS